MRSELVFATKFHMHGRYPLCRLVAHAARRMHRPNDRIQDTLNEVLMLLSHSSAIPDDPQASAKQAEVDTPSVDNSRRSSSRKSCLKTLQLGTGSSCSPRAAKLPQRKKKPAVSYPGPLQASGERLAGACL